MEVHEGSPPTESASKGAQQQHEGAAPAAANGHVPMDQVQAASTETIASVRDEAPSSPPPTPAHNDPSPTSPPAPAPSSLTAPAPAYAEEAATELPASTAQQPSEEAAGVAPPTDTTPPQSYAPASARAKEAAMEPPASTAQQPPKEAAGVAPPTNTTPPQLHAPASASAEDAATEPPASTVQQPPEEAAGVAPPSDATPPQDPTPAAPAPFPPTPANQPSREPSHAPEGLAGAASKGPAPLSHPEGPSEVAAADMSVKEAKCLFEQVSPSKKGQAALPKPQPRTGASPSHTPVKASDPAPKANDQSSRAAAAASKVVPSSPHDLKNTVNASQLLKSGAFSRMPGKDLIPYDELVLLRLEDSIDVTRKEDYLSQEEFEKVFKMTRDAYAKLPGWKRAQAKKKVHLF